MRFGPDETIRCIQDVAVPGPKGEPLCLAHKLTVLRIGGAVHMSDDGYVLAPRHDQSYYYDLTRTRIGELQAAGTLPRPLPGYALTVGDYLWGYSLWWALLLLLVGGAVLVVRRRARSVPR